MYQTNIYIVSKEKAFTFAFVLFLLW